MIQVPKLIDAQKSEVKFPSINTCQDSSVGKAWGCNKSYQSPRVSGSSLIGGNFFIDFNLL